MSHGQNPSTQRWNVGRDVCAATLLIIGGLLPWSIHFGVGVPSSKGLIFVLLAVVTLLSLATVAATYIGPSRTTRGSCCC